MILGKKADIKAMLPYVNGGLKKGLEYLLATDFSKLADGKYEIDGNDVYAKVSSYKTKAQNEKKPEAHDAYIDIQYMAKGNEKLYFAPRSPERKVVEDKLAEKDLAFYDNVPEKDVATLSDGDYVIFFPWEIHRPGCNVGTEAEDVQKIIVKVKVAG
jgi:biofilm protein TabA